MTPTNDWEGEFNKEFVDFAVDFDGKQSGPLMLNMNKSIEELKAFISKVEKAAREKALREAAGIALNKYPNETLGGQVGQEICTAILAAMEAGEGIEKDEKPKVYCSDTDCDGSHGET